MASVSCHCNLSCVRALVWGWGTHIWKWRGAPTDASKGYRWQISCKKGVIGWRIRKKGVIKCESAQNPGNFNHFWRNFRWDLQLFSKFDDFAGKFWSKQQNEGSLGVKLNEILIPKTKMKFWEWARTLLKPVPASARSRQKTHPQSAFGIHNHCSDLSYTCTPVFICSHTQGLTPSWPCKLLNMTPN